MAEVDLKHLAKEELLKMDRLPVIAVNGAGRIRWVLIGVIEGENGELFIRGIDSDCGEWDGDFYEMDGNLGWLAYLPKDTEKIVRMVNSAGKERKKIQEDLQNLDWNVTELRKTDEVTDFSDCDEATKATIIANFERLAERDVDK